MGDINNPVCSVSGCGQPGYTISNKTLRIVCRACFDHEEAEYISLRSTIVRFMQRILNGGPQ